MDAPFSLEAYLQQKSPAVEALLRRSLARLAGAPERLYEAMAYSLLGGGKRLRPLLCLAFAEAVRRGPAPPAAEDAACAVEYVHTYSLVHDDLPAMDDDELRRGKPTSHVVYGEALAILAGDALLTEAFALLAAGPEPERQTLVQLLATAAGARGMVGGQVLDIAQDRPREEAFLRRMHTLKTGRLLQAACAMGVVSARGSAQQLASAEAYGEAVGLAFQIADDILDVTATDAKLGKPTGADAAAGRPTFPAVLGLEASRKLGASLVDAAVAAVQRLEPVPGPLQALARYSVERSDLTLLERVDSPEALRALPEEELPALCAALREEIISVCGRVGGHLGASLGAVELVVALHRVFHSPQDALVFDVGHQAYAHKLLTGRRSRMSTLRQEGGVAPFLDPKESVHDAFGAGHACTAVSVAVGMARAMAARGSLSRAVAVVGDGGLTGGLTFEGLNNAGAAPHPLVVVLNDNGMSISSNVGAVARLLQSTEARSFFQALGFTYLGPVDGHDFSQLLPTLAEARRALRPVLVHARTEKGRGFSFAEADSQTRGHAMGPYELRDGKLVRSRGGQRTFSEAFAEALEKAMADDERVVAVTPAMLEGSALVGLKARFPERVLDVGIAEQHAVAVSAGVAARGLRPVCVIYSTFLQRAMDQLVHDVVLPGLAVTLAIDRAGLVGADGATHQGAFDMAFLRPLSGLRLYAPVVGADVGPLLATALSGQGPAALRFPRGTLPEVPQGFPPSVAPVRTARWLQKPSQPEAAIVTIGPLGLSALEAAEALPHVAVLDARVLSPLDTEAVDEALETGRVVSVEEGTLKGGLGSALLERGAATKRRPRVRLLGLPDEFVRHGDARAQRKRLGLDTLGIGRAVRELLQA